MSTTSTSVVAPPHITSRKGLLRFRRGLIERISLTATILVLFAVTLIAGTAVFLVRSVLTSYEGQQRMRMDQYGSSLTSLLDELAKRKLIRPLMTQGHISDLYRNRIVVDAMTTQGSSGTPMFGETGEVIGVTFAVMADDSTSNFVAGIHGAIEQLRIAGWKPMPIKGVNRHKSEERSDYYGSLPGVKKRRGGTTLH